MSRSEARGSSLHIRNYPSNMQENFTISPFPLLCQSLFFYNMKIVSHSGSWQHHNEALRSYIADYLKPSAQIKEKLNIA